MLHPLHHLRIPFLFFPPLFFSPLPYSLPKEMNSVKDYLKNRSHIMLPFLCFYLLLNIRSGPLEWKKYPGDRMNACTRGYLSLAAWIICCNKPWQPSVTFLIIYSLHYYSKSVPQVVSKDPVFHIIHLPLDLFNPLQEQVLKVTTNHLLYF